MPVAWTPDKEVVTLFYLADMLRQLDTQGFVPPTPHGQKYIAWVRDHLDMRAADGTDPLREPQWQAIFEDPARREQYLSEFATTGTVEAAVQSFGSQLAAMVREESDPLDQGILPLTFLVFYYEGNCSRRSASSGQALFLVFFVSCPLNHFLQGSNT